MSDIQAIRELRERTHLGMTECKSALTEAKGDVEIAVEILQKRGSLKKADPLLETREGVVKAVVINGVGKIAELNCQTDFAARSELFQKFMDKFLLSDLDREDLLKDYFTKTESGQLLCKQLGEKVVLKRHNILWADELSSESKYAVTRAYNHHSGKIAVLVSLGIPEEHLADSAELIAFADELAMQIAANKPLAINRADSSLTERVERQMALFNEQSQDKPAAMREKIVRGKLDKWFQENTLLEQESIVHAKKRIDSLAEELRKKLGSQFTVTHFIRYELGE